jgi:hypothetical protein
MALTNAEKQARWREPHLGIDGEKVASGFTLNAGTRAKNGTQTITHNQLSSSLARIADAKW